MKQLSRTGLPKIYNQSRFSYHNSLDKHSCIITAFFICVSYSIALGIWTGIVIQSMRIDFFYCNFVVFLNQSLSDGVHLYARSTEMISIVLFFIPQEVMVYFPFRAWSPMPDFMDSPWITAFNIPLFYLLSTFIFYASKHASIKIHIAKTLKRLSDEFLPLIKYLCGT